MWPDVRPCVTCVRVHDRSRPYVATYGGPTASRVAVIAQELNHKVNPAARSRRGRGHPVNLEMRDDVSPCTAHSRRRRASGGVCVTVCANQAITNFVHNNKQEEEICGETRLSRRQTQYTSYMAACACMGKSKRCNVPRGVRLASTVSESTPRHASFPPRSRTGLTCA